METILEFIKVFQSESNNKLFTDCACYWFAVILHKRFPHSVIVYDPERIHFATLIGGIIYDIEGVVEDYENYKYWDEYAAYELDAGNIIRDCINIV